MSKRLLTIGVVPLLAAFALAMAPAASQAAVPRFFSNGSELKAGKQQFLTSWGTLTLNGTAKVTCHNVIGGFEENPTSATEAGIGAVESFDPFDCTANFTCPEVEFAPGLKAPTSPAVEATDLPWPTKLIEPEAGVPRTSVQAATVEGTAEPEHVRVIVGCNAPELGEDKVTGTAFVAGPKEVQQSKAPFGSLKGTGPGSPGSNEYDPGSGSLEAEGSGETVVGVTEGKTKTLGYAEEEHTYVEG